MPGSHLRSRRARALGRARTVATVGLPVAVLVLLLGGALGAVASLGPPPRAAAALAPDRVPPAVPLLDLRRDLAPLADAAADRALQRALDAQVAALPPDTCLVVRTDDVDYEHRADDPQVPASAQKLLTGVAALSALGTDVRYVTRLGTGTAPVDGVVSGDVVLVGGGDPVLATGAYAARFANQPQLLTDLAVLADAVAAAGVTRVTGSVLADERRYDQERYHPAWPRRFVVQDQTGPLSALAVNDGFAAWPAEGATPVEPAADPAVLGAQVLLGLLAERGIAVEGGAGRVAPDAPAPPVVLAEVASPPLGEVVAQLLRESDNATAELVLKELGLRLRGEGTFAAGAGAVADVLAAEGLDVADAVVVDGSGLAPGNAASCTLLADLLDHPPTRAEVRDGLAVAGRTGTLARRFVGTPLEGRVRAKTGTLNQVTSLVGTVEGADGTTVRFALVVNVPEPAVIQAGTVAAQADLLAVLAAHPARPDLSDLAPAAQRGGDGGRPGEGP